MVLSDWFGVSAARVLQAFVALEAAVVSRLSEVVFIPPTAVNPEVVDRVPRIGAELVVGALDYDGAALIELASAIDPKIRLAGSCSRIGSNSSVAGEGDRVCTGLQNAPVSGAGGPEAKVVC